MSKRLDAFRNFRSHAWLKKPFEKLSADELLLCEEFIIKHDYLPKGEFEYAINRMFLDKPKPKNFSICQELLTCANSSI